MISPRQLESIFTIAIMTGASSFSAFAAVVCFVNPGNILLSCVFAIMALVFRVKRVAEVRAFRAGGD